MRFSARDVFAAADPGVECAASPASARRHVAEVGHLSRAEVSEKKETPAARRGKTPPNVTADWRSLTSPGSVRPRAQRALLNAGVGGFPLRSAGGAPRRNSWGLWGAQKPCE